MRLSKINRMGAKDSRTVRRIIAEAVRQSRAPNQPSLGTSGQGGSLVSPNFNSPPTVPIIIGEDAEGNELWGTLHTFILGIDKLGDIEAELRVAGQKTKYYGTGKTGVAGETVTAQHGVMVRAMYPNYQEPVLSTKYYGNNKQGVSGEIL